LCVGVDPHLAILQEWGLPADATGLERCARTLVEATAGEVAVYKPQSAFFEVFGSAGIAVLERVLTDIREAGAISLLDVKRGDIGSTMAAYAHAYLGDGPLASDAITISPYLGFGSLQPAVDLAIANGRGVYVLVRTSNPESDEVQMAHAEGRSVAQQVIDTAAKINAGQGASATVPGPIGAVVGLTHQALDVDLSSLQGSILVPGLGAQGGTPEHVAELFGAQTPLTLPSSSRDIAKAGPDAAAIRERTAALAAALR